jgi:hypothetical protein
MACHHFHMPPRTRSRAEPVVTVAKRILSARETEVAGYAKLYPLLLAEIDEIMADWDRSTDELPWNKLEEAERQNNLISVITRVIDCAMSSESREIRVNAMIEAACSHGEFRRKQGFDVGTLLQEYDRLRSATWNNMKDLVPAPTSFDAIFVIDGLFTIASRATVLGFHRAEMLENGLWDKHITELKKLVTS